MTDHQTLEYMDSCSIEMANGYHLLLTTMSTSRHLTLTPLPSTELYLRELSEKTKRRNTFRFIKQAQKLLWGAHCRKESETWLPLLEKAFAKAHGDHDSLDGGWPGEGLEDLTGGVTTELLTSDILDEEDFWKKELMRVKDEFLFSCATGVLEIVHYFGWNRQGIEELHAYTIMEAKELQSGQKLLKLRNPWGTLREGSWKGAWSDGSKEWMPETLTELHHQQGVDSAFWISYEDFLRKYQVIDRTRLFRDRDWRLAQCWSSIDVPWSVVIVLSQLDDRYFRGLEGQYRFKLYFRLHSIHKLGSEDYFARSHGNSVMNRSVVAELSNLQADTYCVFVKILAERDTDKKSTEEVVEEMCRDKKDNEKLSQVGFSYNIAHDKGASHMKTQMKLKVEEEEKKRFKMEEEASKEDAARSERMRIKGEGELVVHINATSLPTSQEIKSTQGADIDSKAEQVHISPTGTSALLSSPDRATPHPALQRTDKEDDNAVLDRNDIRSSSQNIQTTAAVVKRIGDQETRNQIEILHQGTEKGDPTQGAKSAQIRDVLVNSNSEEVNQECQHEKLLAKLQDLAYDGADDFDDDNIDPWNAVCMVGLRVYSKDLGLHVEVVLPVDAKKTGLDIDDKLADMTVQAPAGGNKDEKKQLPLRMKLNRSFTT